MSEDSEGLPLDPRVWAAVDELRQVISRRWPTTTFSVHSGIDDPRQIWLVATMDIDDPDEVMDLLVDRLAELQIDENLPVHLAPVHTPLRVAQTLSSQRRASASYFSRCYVPPSPARP